MQICFSNSLWRKRTQFRQFTRVCPYNNNVQTQKMKSTSSVPKSVERMGYALWVFHHLRMCGWNVPRILRYKHRTVRCVLLSEQHRNAIREPVTDAEKLDAIANFPKKHSDLQSRIKTGNWQIRSRSFKESSEDMGLQILAQSHSQKLNILLISHSKLIVLPHHSK